MKKSRLLEWIICLGMAGFFIWSGTRKLEDLSAFTESVGNFQLGQEERLSFLGENAGGFFEAPYDAVIAYFVPWVEIIAAVAVLIPFLRMGGALVFAGLISSFNLALWSAWSRGITDLKCGCHGVSEEPTDYAWKIGTNFGWISACVVIVGLVCYHRRLASAGGSSKIEP